MKKGQQILARRKGFGGWANWRKFKVSAVGDKGVLGYFDAFPLIETHLNPSNYEWKEEV